MSTADQLNDEAAARAAFLRAAERVLEAMFFDSLCGEPVEADPPAGMALARVVFRGSRMGWLEVALDEKAGTTLASNFLGVEHGPTRPEVESTLAELANMFCGSFLSLYDPRGSFEIGSPHVDATGTNEIAPVLGSLSHWHLMPVEAGGIFWRLFWEDVC